MPRSYRLIVFATVGWLVLGAAPQAAEPNKNQAHSSSTARRAKTTEPLIVKTISGDPRDTGCDQSHEDRRSDLCAQWKAADAPESSAKAAWVLGILGSTIGACTLIAAIMAARYASDAARETKRGADAAEGASRPWLDVKLRIEGVSVDYFQQGYVANTEVIIKNTGISPANHVRPKTIGIFFDRAWHDNIDEDIMTQRYNALGNSVVSLMDELRSQSADGPTVHPIRKYSLYEEARFSWDWSSGFPEGFGWIITGLVYSIPGGVGECAKVFSVRTFDFGEDDGFEQMGTKVMAYAEVKPVIWPWPRFGYSR